MVPRVGRTRRFVLALASALALAALAAVVFRPARDGPAPAAGTDRRPSGAEARPAIEDAERAAGLAARQSPLPPPWPPPPSPEGPEPVARRRDPAPPISGTVSDASGAPVAGAEIVAMPGDLSANAPDRDVRDPRETVYAKSGADGRFALDGLEHGPYSLHVDVPGFAPTNLYGRLPGSDVAVRMKTYATARVTVLGPDGRPLANARVDATLLGEGGEPTGPQLSDKTDEEGLALIHGLLPGSRHRLRVTPSDARDDVQPYEDRSWTPGETTVRAVAYESVAGRILGRDGTSIADAALWWRIGAEPWRRGWASEGRFRVRVADGTEVSLVARQNTALSPEPVGDLVTARAGETSVVVRYDAGAFLSFQLSGLGPSGGTAALFDQRSGQEIRRAPAEATLRFDGLDPKGVYALWVEADARWGDAEAVALAADLRAGADPIPVRASPPGIVWGVVRLPASTVVASSVVTVELAGGVRRPANLLEDGRFALGGLPVGAVRVTVSVVAGGRRLEGSASAQATAFQKGRKDENEEKDELGVPREPESRPVEIHLSDVGPAAADAGARSR